MEIKSISSKDFRKYGRVISHVDFSGLVEEMKKTPIPDGVVYEPSIKELESLPVKGELSKIIYGEMPIQIGYCNGHNVKLNAFEYHRSSEINVAATDAVLLVGLQSDIEDDFTYDTSKVEAFLVPAGTAVEVYATTLHYAPCGAGGKGFQVAIVLPKGTNYPIQDGHTRVDADRKAANEDALLAATNKWLIGHEDGGLGADAFIGLKGINPEID